jgi:hypothetical protein
MAIPTTRDTEARETMKDLEDLHEESQRVHNLLSKSEALQEPVSFTLPVTAPGMLLHLVWSTSSSVAVMMLTPSPRHLPLFWLVRVVRYSLEL